MSTPPPTRILVVSSIPSVLRIIRPPLEAAGYEVLQYHVAQQDPLIALDTAIEGMVQTLSPELLVLDINFGEESAGWQLIQALNLLSGAAAIPWVVCIAAAEYELGLVPHLLRQGIGVVLKPFTTRDLLRMVWAACPAVGLVTPEIAAPEIAAPEHVEQSESQRTAEDETNDDQHQRRRRVTDGPSGPNPPGRRVG